jgi:hypothetical protein
LTLGSITYYFRGRFNFAGNPDGARLSLATIVDDGAVFYLNGQEIYRLGMPEGAFTSSTFSARTVTDAALEGPFEVAATGLLVGENVLAVEVHQINTTSSDIVFGAAVDVATLAAASFTPGAPNSVAGDLPAFPSVWINEVLPQNTAGLMDNAGEREPWIELFNADSQPLNLQDWSLTDDFSALAKWSFPPGTSIPARGYLLVWADGETAESMAGALHANFRLAPSSGTVALARAQAAGRAVVDYVHYNALAANQSFGAVTDAAPFQRDVLETPTPGRSNATGQLVLPVLGVALQENSKFQISWKSVIGMDYQVQACSDLAAPNWQTVREVIGNGSLQSIIETLSTTEAQRYYRILAQ